MKVLSFLKTRKGIASTVAVVATVLAVSAAVFVKVKADSLELEAGE